MEYGWSLRSADRYKAFLVRAVGTAETPFDSFQRMALSNNTAQMQTFLEGLRQFEGFSDAGRIQYLETLGFEYWQARDIAVSKAALMADLLTFVPDFNRLEVLDVGSGKGDMLIHLTKEFYLRRGVGIDPSHRHRDFARNLAQSERAQSLIFQDGVATNLPFEDSSFDVVFSTMAMHWSSSPQKWLSEMARVLRPGGYFYINYHNKNSCTPDEATRILAAASVNVTKKTFQNIIKEISHTTIEGRKAN